MSSNGNDFGWALAQMRDGNKVRRQGWRPEEWIALRDDRKEIVDEDGGVTRFLDSKPILATDWTVAESGK